MKRYRKAAPMFAHWTVLKKGLVLVLVPLLFQFLLLLMTAALQAYHVDAVEWTQHSLEVLAQTETVLRRMIDSETGTRGYVLTEQIAFTKPRHDAIREVPAAIARLRELVRDNAEQADRVNGIAQKAASLLLWHQETCQLVSDGNRRQAATRINGSNLRMDELREAINHFTREEQKLAVERDRTLSQIQGWIRMLLLGGFCLALVLSVSLAYLFHREIAERMRTLVENTRRLRQGLQAAPPMTGADHIAEMDRAFQEAFAEVARSARKLAEVTARTNQALMAARVGTWCWDFRDESILWDEGMHALFGLQPDAFAGGLPEVLPLIAPEDRDAVNATALRAKETGTSYRHEFRVVWRDGSRHFLASRGEIQRSADGTPIQLTGVCWDITARKEAEATVQRLNAELEQRVIDRTADLAAANRDLAHKNQENEMFVYSVSHDLRSPLVNLQGFSRELTQAAKTLRALLTDAATPSSVRERGTALLDAEFSESIHFIQAAVTRLSGIIDALLRLSRAGRVEYQVRQVPIEEVIRRIVDSLHTTAAERNATISIHPNLPAACGDQTALEQVFANLIGNALHYLDRKRPGAIEIGYLDRQDDAVSESHRTYFVKDNGLGIAPAHRAKVFHAFQRLHPGSGAGEGIGLTIVQRIVERHHGKIWFESTVGQGTTFFVALPTRRTDRVAPSASIPHSAPKGTQP